MGKFRKNPIEFEAIQFNGHNFEELQEFTGVRISPSTGADIHIFNPIGTFIPDHQFVDRDPKPTAELWVDANRQWLPIVDWEWVVKDQLGFYPCADEIMKKNNTIVEDPWGDPPNFDQELVWLLNKHSKENYSGTPDWILAEYLRKCLEAWDLGVRLRSDWRGESTELPALSELHKKKVPLVHYDEHGVRNEIGEAAVEQWPGEMLVHGVITGVVPMFDHGAAYSIVDDDEKDTR